MLFTVKEHAMQLEKAVSERTRECNILVHAIM